MRDQLDPITVHPARGKILVQVVEKLEQVTPGGLIVPDMMEERQHLRDTATGRILEIGPPPTPKHVFLKEEKRLAATPNGTGAEWPKTYLDLKVGLFVVFPRDVPVAFTHEDEGGITSRYAIVLQDELICSFDSDSYDGESIVTPKGDMGQDRTDSAEDSFDRKLEYDVEKALSKEA